MKRLIPLLLLAGIVVGITTEAQAQRVSYPKATAIVWASANGGSDSVTANTASLTTSSAPLTSKPISTAGWDWTTSATVTTVYPLAVTYLTTSGTSGTVDSLYYAWETSGDGTNFTVLASSSAQSLVLLNGTNQTVSFPLMTDGDAIAVVGGVAPSWLAPFVRLKLWGDTTAKFVAIGGNVMHREIVSP